MTSYYTKRMFSLADTLQVPVVVRKLKCIFTILATFLARILAISLVIQNSGDCFRHQ